MTRLNLGSGDHQIDGFINVDLYDETADIRADICELPFPDDSVDEIVAYQVIEHVEYWKEQDIFKEIYRVLKPGCKAIVECPDMEFIAEDIVINGDIEEKWIWNIYGQYYRPWDTERYPDALNHEGSKHRNAFTFAKLKRLCEPLGFKLRRRVLEEMYSKYPENLSVELTKL